MILQPMLAKAKELPRAVADSCSLSDLSFAKCGDSGLIVGGCVLLYPFTKVSSAED